ncbi:MAG TPA: Hpt domain-containing protein [Bacteroidia bacterium]|nr:Hpt domain-containing protein [Bacteroidia bacterium]
MNEHTNILKEFDRVSYGDAEVKEKLIQAFLSQKPDEIRIINNCLQEENWKELRNIAHKLKSSFIYLNMPRPIELTEALRVKAGADVEATKKQAKELVIICNEIIEILKSKS